MDISAGVTRIRALALLVVLLVALLAAAGPQGTSAALLSWRHGIIAPKGDAGFELMAREKEFFRKYGAAVEIIYFEGNVQLNNAIIAGAVDSGEEAPDPVFAAILKGVNLKIIGSTIPGNPFAVYARSGIESFRDLKGKTIGVSLPGSLPDILMRAMLKAEGVDPRTLVVVNAGADAQRYTAVKNGKIDAAAASSEFVPQAKKDKINVLGFAKDIVPLYPRFVVVANGRSLERNPDAAVAFLAGEMEGLSYALTHRDETLQLAARTIHVSPDSPRLTYLYDALRNDHMVSPTCEIPRDRLEWLQTFRIGLGLQKSRVDLARVIDGSYRDRALTIARNVLR